MKTAFVVFATALLWAVRVLFAWLCFATGEISVMIVGGVELVALAAGAVNVVRARQWDVSIGSWAVLAHYASAFLVIPEATSSWPLVPLSVLRLVCIVYMGSACTIGGINWVGLVDRGPYAVVRHPLSAVTVASRLAMLAVWPSVWNLSAVTFHCVWSVVDIYFEERWLAAREEWRSYAMRVPWRWVPHVW